uniref:Uncharacterized protein n=1 Tax=Callithrix jacchus TaxID=9483 RepID=A0A8I3X1U4_CALJA
MNSNPGVLPRLECSGVIMAHCSLNFLPQANPCTSSSRVAGTIGMRHHAQVIIFFVEIGVCLLSQAGLELLSSCDPPALASQSVGNAGLSHWDWPA